MPRNTTTIPFPYLEVGNLYEVTNPSEERRFFILEFDELYSEIPIEILLETNTSYNLTYKAKHYRLPLTVMVLDKHTIKTADGNLIYCVKVLCPKHGIFLVMFKHGDLLFSNPTTE